MVQFANNWKWDRLVFDERYALEWNAMLAKPPGFTFNMNMNYLPESFDSISFDTLR